MVLPVAVLFNIIVLVPIVKVFIEMRKGAFDEPALEEHLNSTTTGIRCDQWWCRVSSVDAGSRSTWYARDTSRKAAPRSSPEMSG